MEQIKGMLDIEIVSADTVAAAKAILARGIHLYEAVTPDDLRIRCRVRRQDFDKLKEICQSRGDSLTIRQKSGIIWMIKGLFNRPVLMAGVILLVFLAIYISSRVLFIRVDGNVSIPDRKVLEAAEWAGVYFGASRRDLRSEQVKNTLLEAMPELKWACVNTYGCVAKITVRERSEPEEMRQAYTLGSIVADRDGIITFCTATKGTLVCAPGQAVTKGQVLISGYTDCGIFIQAGQAEGEVYAQTLREMEAVIPVNMARKLDITSQEKNYSLIIGKKRINFWQNSGISDTLCDRMYEEYYVTLPGGFDLPLALAVETLTYRETVSTALNQEKAEALLGTFLENYLCSQMVAGEILSSKTELTAYDFCFCLTGNYVCSEMIGRQQREKIGVYNGESD